jgi:hypothetical protein
MQYIMLFAPGAVQQGFGGMVSWDMLRLFASLTPGQRQGLTSGSQIPFNALSPQAKGYLTKLLFGADTDIVVESQKPKSDAFQMPTFVRRMFGGSKGDYRSEPTEIMPNGLPGNGYVTLNVTKSHVAKMAGDKGFNPMGAGAMGSEELALVRFFKEDPNMSQLAGGFMPSLDELRLGTRTIYDFKFYVAPDVMMAQSLNDNAISKDAPVVKFSSLPSEFQKEIDQKMAEIKKFPFFDPSFLMGGKKNIPPQ